MAMREIIIDWLHLTGAAAWIGGMLFVNLVFMPTMEHVSPENRSKVMGEMVKRFGRIVNIALGLLILSGLDNLPNGGATQWGEIHNNGDYFIFLSIKLMIVVTMAGIGGYMSGNLGPSLIKIAPNTGEKPSTEFLNKSALMRNLSWLNMYLGILLLFFASVLLNGGTLS